MVENEIKRVIKTLKKIIEGLIFKEKTLKKL
jgi:hypothetical protein